MFDSGFDAKPPSEPFFVEWYGHIDTYTDGDAKDAAEQAVADYDASVGEYPDWRLVGVMPYADYDRLVANVDESEELGEGFGDVFLTPQELTWYNVQCVPVPSYEASKVTL